MNPGSAVSSGLSGDRQTNGRRPETYHKLNLTGGSHNLELDSFYQDLGLDKKFDFEAFGTIPSGWRISAARVPDAFAIVGGSAIVIEKASEEQSQSGAPPPDRRVLLALPDAAVDLQRAKWLSRRPGFTAEAASLCHLRRVKEVKASGSVVVDFDYPRGVPLTEVLQSRPLNDVSALHLMRNLLRLVTCLGPSPLRLLGLIDVSMVFLNSKDSLEALIPLGCLLSFVGIRAAFFKEFQRNCDPPWPPELKKAVVQNNEGFVTDLDRAPVTDSYAIAVIALRALGQQRVDGKDIQVEVSPLARDMLQKALHHEPEWRLSGVAALSHPWLKEAVDRRR
jgi:hypothetical protein